MSTSTHPLDAFRCRHSLRPPDVDRIESRAETLQLRASDGLLLLTPAPASDVLFGFPPSSQHTSCGRYLWVIDTRGIPHVLEIPKIPIAAIGSVLKHTNLTGGGEAYLGGELWFADASSIYLSGGSGRYRPTDATQLDDATLVFRSFGYEVTSLGWNFQTNLAKRFLENGA